MNASETEIVKGKIKECQEFINRQHCLPKAKHGNNSLENCVAVHRDTCHKWIHETYGLSYYDPRR